MRKDNETLNTPMPSPRFERMVGIAAKSTVLTLLPAWLVWLLNHYMGSFPTWVWVVTVVPPAVITAWRGRWDRGRMPHQASGAPRTPGRLLQ